MKIRRFLIENYRAIDRVELKLNYSINPIIGVNESGKTTILKAILAFDKGRDRYNAGEHLDPQNKYSTKDTVNCKVTATIILDKTELEDLVKFTKVKTNSDDYVVLKDLKTSTEFELTRHIHRVKPKYEYVNEKLSNPVNTKITNKLASSLPFLLYFDDFTDRVPEDFVFPEEYINNGKLSRARIREWQEIIQEIFRRADTEGINDNEQPLQEFMKIENRDRKRDILSDIEAVLDKEIMREWKKIKKSGKTHLADDSEKLELKIDNPEPNKFEFKVRDKSNQDKKRTFNVNERSKGFQWFFNYMIKLKFNPRYKKKQENSIFLLDEPGSYLHSSAQSELLKELASVSRKNTIIYCTHSQYLLNPSIIKLGSIKITEKQDSIISMHEYGSYKTKKDRGALSPVYQALQLNYAHDFIGNIVITEGITDYYLLDMIRINTEFIKNDITIIPGSGAGNLSTLISIAIPFSDNYLIIFDNDKGGKEASNKYKKEFGEPVSRHFHFYNDKEHKFTLEDHFSNNDKNKLLSLTKSNTVKKAIAILFYDYKIPQKSFINELDKETWANLEDTIIRINEM